MNVPDDVRGAVCAKIEETVRTIAVVSDGDDMGYYLVDAIADVRHETDLRSAGDILRDASADILDAALSALEAAGWKPVRIDVLEPFRRAAEAMNEYDPGFPDEGSILRMSAEWYMRTHEAGEKLNKPLTAGDLRALAAMLTASRHKEKQDASPAQPAQKTEQG